MNAPKKVRKSEDGIWKLEDGRWHLDIRPDGRGGARYRRTFDTKTEAKVRKAKVLAKAADGEQWQPPKKDARRLSTLVNDWFDLYGHTLKDGENRKSILLGTVKRLGNPPARSFTSEIWLNYRRTRLLDKKQNVMAGTSKKTVSKNSVNHEHAYLSAVFGTLIKLKSWQHDNPMKGIPKLAIDEAEIIYLELDQVARLLDEVSKSSNPNVLKMTKICLATGCRWGEALSLSSRHVRGGKFHFIGTKNSKTRAVPADPGLIAEILEGVPAGDDLFTTSKTSTAEAFGRAIKAAKIHLPDGQLTHILRHTYASQYMIADGNILKLKEVLGHKTLAMTMRYAKLSPQHLTQSLTHNTLTLLAPPWFCFLSSRHVRGGKFHFIGTKNSKTRAVPADPGLIAEILEGVPAGDDLFTTSKTSTAEAFGRAIKAAKIHLPDGQLTHILRHTYASQYMIADGNILKLKEVLGHKTLAMTMRYAKLSPQHLTQSLTHNTLTLLEVSTNRPH